MGLPGPDNGHDRVPPSALGRWAWSGIQRKCSAIFQLLFLKTPLKDMVPWPLQLMHGSYTWCTGWFPAQVRRWGPLQGQHRFCSLPHICQKWTFWHLTCFCLLHSVCVILTHLALHFGPFTWQFHFKETHKAGAFKFLLQLCIYNLVFSPALKRCVKCFDHM